MDLIELWFRWSQILGFKLGDLQRFCGKKTQRVRVSSQQVAVQKLGDPLIPGLSGHVAGKAVCKRWYQLFGNKEWFFTRRKEMGFQDPWLFIFVTGKIQWHVLDHTHHSIIALYR
ncbi:hypothetical protein Hanom_Chr06g00563231 [Helianthus anomalus]